jgi:hypothetical protein
LLLFSFLNLEIKAFAPFHWYSGAVLDI